MKILFLTFTLIVFSVFFNSRNYKVVSKASLETEPSMSQYKQVIFFIP